MNAEKLVNSFEEYSGIGGQLNQESFIKAMELRTEIDNGQGFRDYGAILSQAKWMAGRYCLGVTDEQINLYILLRNSNVSCARGGLSDQGIFAETLLLTGDIVNRESFVNKNPLVFSRVVFGRV